MLSSVVLPKIQTSTGKPPTKEANQSKPNPLFRTQELQQTTRAHPIETLILYYTSSS